MRASTNSFKFKTRIIFSHKGDNLIYVYSCFFSCFFYTFNINFRMVDEFVNMCVVP